MFKRKLPEPPAFVHEALADGLRLRLLQGGQAVDVHAWPERAPDAAEAIAFLLARGDDTNEPSNASSDVVIGNDHVRISWDLVAVIPAGLATALNLPAPTALGLELKPRGNIAEDEFHIDIDWIRPGGQPARVKIQGALITVDGVTRRIPEPLWSLYGAAGRLQSPVDQSERFAGLADLRAAWPDDDPFAQVTSSPFLEDLRIYYASALSLKLTSLTEKKTEFEPVLFGARSVQAANEEDRDLDEDDDNILSNTAQELFGQDRFRRERGARPVYLLRKGEYIYIDPALRPVLQEVRELQDAPETVRRDFVLNPIRILRERLGEDTAERIGLDSRFFETTQFSARVAGVDVWRKPVLPWLTPSVRNQWLPERFGLRIGDDYFVLDPLNVEEILRRFDQAQATGLSVVNVEGLLGTVAPGSALPPQTLPVTPEVGETLKRFAPYAASAGEQLTSSGPVPGTTDESDAKLFLVVRENFDKVEYSANDSDSSTAAALAPVSLPRRLNATLKPHQLDGLNWLADCARLQRPGALLADDMGLGKTLQAIAFMAWLQDEAASGQRVTRPFLIVAPTGLLGNWRNEIERFLDDEGLGPLIPAFGGTLKKLREESGLTDSDIVTGKAALDAAAWRDGGVVLTTYETMRDYHFSFAGTRFGVIVYDEIQKLKNPTSQMTRAAKSLNSDFCLGMTGTPVENRLQDLWSIMDVITPGLLGSGRDFDRRFQPSDREALANLKALLLDNHERHPSYMLRRLKSDALKDMPTKHIHTFETHMPSGQSRAYRDVVMKASAAVAAGTMGKGGMLSTLASMRGVSLHPQDPRAAPVDLQTYAAESARLSRTMEVLDAIARRSEKALVFVEDLAMQDRLAALIKARFNLSRLPMKINGGVPGAKRQAMVDVFQKEGGQFDVMILSPKAGGVGLTLTAANHVVHLSRWWNPAVEDQATDRVFRIGQLRDVHVYLPLAVHPDQDIGPASFDLKLNALIERKRQLTRDLFLPPECDENELANLFGEITEGHSEADFRTPADATSEQVQITPPPPETLVQTANDPTIQALVPPPSLSVGLRRWRCNSGEQRPVDEIVSLFTGCEVHLVHIEDPYALASDSARRAQVGFVRALRSVAKSVAGVRVDYNPDAKADIDETSQRREFGSRYQLELATPLPKLALVRRERRRGGDDFHDRFIRIGVKGSNGEVEQHELSIGRGAEALFDDRHQCNVMYAPPGS